MDETSFNGQERMQLGDSEDGRTSVAQSTLKDHETNLLCIFAPPPRKNTARKQQYSTNPTSEVETSTNFELDNGNYDEIDAEWGLEIEKQSGQVDQALFNKLAHFHTLKEEQGVHFNQSLNRNRSFRNPHIYSKLVEWVEVEETASGYTDMIKGDKVKADEVWMSSQEARQELKLQGGKDAISFLQKRRQEEVDERKKRARRDNIDFVGSKNSSPHTSSSIQAASSYSRSEALALAESRAKKIRDEIVSRGNPSSGQGKDRQVRKEEGRDKIRQHRHHH